MKCSGQAGHGMQQAPKRTRTRATPPLAIVTVPHVGLAVYGLRSPLPVLGGRTSPTVTRTVTALSNVRATPTYTLSTLFDASSCKKGTCRPLRPLAWMPCSRSSNVR